MLTVLINPKFLSNIATIDSKGEIPLIVLTHLMLLFPIINYFLLFFIILINHHIVAVLVFRIIILELIDF